MSKSLSGKVALVTGGSSGIGRATALAFAREGAKVVVADVNVEGGQEVVGGIVAAGGEAIFVKTDVSNTADVEALVEGAVAAYGRLDCAFNNAGVGGGAGPLHESSEESWARAINTNLKGVWLCMRSEIPQMLKQGSGSIVNTASVAGLVGFARSPIYAASKHGVVGLTRSAALQYATDGIRINCVCPGLILTPMAATPEFRAWALEREPIGRMGAPEEVAEAALWLCSDAASFVTGEAMAVDGGWLAQ